MPAELKPIVDFESTFQRLDIRMGKIVSIGEAPGSIRKSYAIRADFGKYGVKLSVARLTFHKPNDLIDKYIFGVLNLPPKKVGDMVSEFLCLGVQIQGEESGEATPVIPLSQNVKVGSKLF